MITVLCSGVAASVCVGGSGEVPGMADLLHSCVPSTGPSAARSINTCGMHPCADIHVRPGRGQRPSQEASLQWYSAYQAGSTLLCLPLSPHPFSPHVTLQACFPKLVIQAFQPLQNFFGPLEAGQLAGGGLSPQLYF